MKRRNTEKQHIYADKVFKQLNIFDLQGVLFENGKYNIGLESYHVKQFSDIDFKKLDKNSEISKFRFCEALDVPYYIIFTSETKPTYLIYELNSENNNFSYFYKMIFY